MAPTTSCGNSSLWSSASIERKLIIAFSVFRNFRSAVTWFVLEERDGVCF